MLRSERFLGQFLPVDRITNTPLYLPGYKLTEPGYNDGGPGHRILFVGNKPEVSHSHDTINKFLDVMEFETPADRTNAVAAALTVMLRTFWSGGKPVMCVTADKSHAGKDTIISFATGIATSVSISYQATNWCSNATLLMPLDRSPTLA